LCGHPGATGYAGGKISACCLVRIVFVIVDESVPVERDSLKPDDEFNLAAAELGAVQNLLKDFVAQPGQQLAVQLHHLVA